MIQSFADKETKLVWALKRSRKLSSDIQQRALAKLAMIDAAEVLDDLKLPPGNRLHDLKDDRAGQHAVSINKKWRICFCWNNGNAYDVEVTNHYT